MDKIMDFFIRKMLTEEYEAARRSQQEAEAVRRRQEAERQRQQAQQQQILQQQHQLNMAYLNAQRTQGWFTSKFP